MPFRLNGINVLAASKGPANVRKVQAAIAGAARYRAKLTMP